MLISSLDFVRHSRFCDSRIPVNAELERIYKGDFKLDSTLLRQFGMTFTAKSASNLVYGHAGGVLAVEKSMLANSVSLQVAVKNTINENA